MVVLCGVIAGFVGGCFAGEKDCANAEVGWSWRGLFGELEAFGYVADMRGRGGHGVQVVVCSVCDAYSTSMQ